MCKLHFRIFNFLEIFQISFEINCFLAVEKSVDNVDNSL